MTQRPAPAAARVQKDLNALCRTVGGTLVAEGLVLIEHRYSRSTVHGKHPLAVALPDTGSLYFDTETSGLAGGSGTVAFMLGMARFEAGQLVIRQYLMSSFAAETAMLKQARPWFESAQNWVSFNGKTFDLPLLESRYRLQRQGNPFSEQTTHHDLLHPLRRAYRNQWPDCRLARAETQLLGVVREDDLPGSEAPAAWFDWLHKGDHERLAGVVRHNALDLLSLVTLKSTLTMVYEEPLRFGADPVAMAQYRLDGGDESGALELLQQTSQLPFRGLRMLALLYRRRGEWPQAISLWEYLAERGCSDSLEHLAKYHEHQRGDYLTALGLSYRLPNGEARQRRIARLLRRTGASGELPSAKLR